MARPAVSTTRRLLRRRLWPTGDHADELAGADGWCRPPGPDLSRHRRHYLGHHITVEVDDLSQPRVAINMIVQLNGGAEKTTGRRNEIERRARWSIPTNRSRGVVVLVNAEVVQKIAQTGDICRHVRGFAPRPPGDLGPDRRDPPPRCFGVERSGAVRNTPEAGKAEKPGGLFRSLAARPGGVTVPPASPGKTRARLSPSTSDGVDLVLAA